MADRATPPDDSPPFWWRDEQASLLHGYEVVGRDERCLFCMDADGCLWLVDPDGQLPTRFVDSSMQQFGAILSAFQRVWANRQDAGEDEAAEATAELTAAIAGLDPHALNDPDSYWPVLLEQMRDGLL
jgi:hypothetical protein